MALTLTPLQYYSASDIYHYTVDNRPLVDVQTNLNSIKTALDPLLATSTNQVMLTMNGAWAGGIVPTFSILPDLLKPAAYKIRCWIVEDQGVSTSQNTYFEDILLLSVTAGPTVAIQLRTNITLVSYGATTPTWVYSQAGNNVQVAFSNYSGSNGHMFMIVERFGV